MPWMNSQQAALEKEKYGLNADQRITELSQQAKKVKNNNNKNNKKK